jgi:hypothetical protein
MKKILENTCEVLNMLLGQILHVNREINFVAHNLVKATIKMIFSISNDSSHRGLR